MEQDENRLASLLPDVAAQLRVALSSLYLAAAQLAPADAREKDPELDRKAAVLDQSYYRLLRLATSLSAASCFAEDAPLALQDWDIVELVSDLCEKSGAVAPFLGLELRFVCALPRCLCAVAPNELEQAVYQLLSNAFKFTPSGGTVTVELRVKNGKVLLSVADTGRGIPEERLAALFDYFRHVGQMDPPPHGLGLGLALCRRIAHAHGGSLLVESKEGQGSRFTLCLPDRRCGGSVSDVRFDYAGGFNRTLMALSDALPVKAFLRNNQD